MSLSHWRLTFPSPATSSSSPSPSLPSARRTRTSGIWSRMERVTSSGRETSPPAALSNLENLAKTDFKSNLGQIIHDIYQTAHLMFNDMPQGDHKKRAKYRFASKTLMRILPA